MQIAIVSTDDLKRVPVDTSKMVKLEIRIGDVIYSLTEKDGALSVSLDGQIVAKPRSANILYLVADK